MALFMVDGAGTGNLLEESPAWRPGEMDRSQHPDPEFYGLLHRFFLIITDLYGFVLICVFL